MKRSKRPSHEYTAGVLIGTYAFVCACREVGIVIPILVLACVLARAFVTGFLRAGTRLGAAALLLGGRATRND